MDAAALVISPYRGRLRGKSILDWADKGFSTGSRFIGKNSSGSLVGKRRGRVTMRRQFGQLRASLAHRYRAPRRDTSALRWSLLALALLAVLVLLLWKVPEWHVAAVAYTGPSAAHDRMSDENAMRATLAQIIGGGVLLIGLYFTARNLQVAQRNVHATEEGKITDRFSKAIEQLASDKLGIRLGGIYALERVARDSERDHGPVLDVLTAYVREYAPFPLKVQRQRRTTSRNPRHKQSAASTGVSEKIYQQPTDIRAIFTVIGRLQRIFGDDRYHRIFGAGKDYHLDLRATNLARVPFRKTWLMGAILSDAFSLRSDLTEAHLEGAHLENAKLVWSFLNGAHLEGAHLERAILRASKLNGAHLNGAHLNGAIFYLADLTGADLTGTHDLTEKQLMEARTYKKAILPSHLSHFRTPEPGD